MALMTHAELIFCVFHESLQLTGRLRLADLGRLGAHLCDTICHTTWNC